MLTRVKRLARRVIDDGLALVERTRTWNRGVRPRQARFERFGAILQTVVPRALVFVDRDYARRVRGLVTSEPAAWTGPEIELGDAPLSAPLEAHLQLTNKCAAGCQGCYTGASVEGAPNEWGLVEWKRALDALADAGVFHVALGGGESAALPWLGELADHARERGIIPNLTTSGLDGLDALVAIADRFGQINVSLDGLGATYAAVRGFDGFARADAAIRRLRAAKREIGINVVVTRHNFDELDTIFAYASDRRLSEVELLRFKPSGRGARTYTELRCTDAQHRAFLPAILAHAKRHAIRVKVDCSYTPMIVHHASKPDDGRVRSNAEGGANGIDRGLLAELAVYGCTGGDFLVGAKPGGQLTACSFASPPPTLDDQRPKVDALARYWNAPDAFGAFRRWREAAEPCASCTYHTLCRGGCKVVSAHVTGELSAPDPECPRVVDHGASRSTTKPRHHLPVI